MDILQELKEQFNNKIDFREKRKGITQLIGPFFHEDGDMMDIFITESPTNPGKIRLCDYGMTIMHLSYDYDIDTPNREGILDKIVSEHGLYRDDGNIYVDVDPQMLYQYVFQYSQTIAKVSSMQYFKREVIRNLFYEQLDEFIEVKLSVYKPATKILPIPDRDDLEVDYAFTLDKKKLFLFGIKDSTKARLTTISCLEFQKAKLPFKSIAVHEDFDALPKKDRTRITSAVDKQFPDLADFKQNAEQYFEREAV
ncbi:MAG: DUF1828 domain-containing protein [Syntrophomonadaceae bacterium]|nr:DUF1828 domain-containing protein [Syntrophomonadaceae bacterium]